MWLIIIANKFSHSLHMVCDLFQCRNGESRQHSFVSWALIPGFAPIFVTIVRRSRFPVFLPGLSLRVEGSAGVELAERGFNQRGGHHRHSLWSSSWSGPPGSTPRAPTALAWEKLWYTRSTEVRLKHYQLLQQSREWKNERMKHCSWALRLESTGTFDLEFWWKLLESCTADFLMLCTLRRVDAQHILWMTESQKASGGV